MKKKILLFAPLVSHASWGRVSMMANAEIDFSIFDTSTRKQIFDYKNYYPFSQAKSIDHRTIIRGPENKLLKYQNLLLENLRALSWASENKSEINEIKELLNQNNPDEVFLYYGPEAIRYLRILRRLDFDKPINIILNLIPSTLIARRMPKRYISGSLSPEYNNYRHWLRSADRCFVASNEMKDFVVKKFCLDKSMIYIYQDYLPVSDIPRSIPDLKSQSLIYLGAPERWGANIEIDLVDEEFQNLIYNGFQIASASFSGFLKQSKKAIQYPRFSDQDVLSGDLARYANCFHGALIYYSNANDRERFRSTLPTRFFSSLDAGIPLIVKRCGLTAVENYVKYHDIGIVYDDPREVKKFISDKNSYNKTRDNAARHRLKHNPVTQGKDLTKLLGD